MWHQKLFLISVAFRENDPKQGFVYLLINVPGVIVQSGLGKKPKPLNVEILDEASTFETKWVDYDVLLFQILVFDKSMI